MNLLTYFFVMHTGVFIGMIMFNMLIAIIQGTFTQFSEDRGLTDVEEVIDMLSEMAAFLNFWKTAKEWIFGVRAGGERENVFFHFLVRVEEGDELGAVVERVGGLEDRIFRIEEELVRKHKIGVEWRDEVKECFGRVEERAEGRGRDVEEKMDRILEVLAKLTEKDNRLDLDDCEGGVSIEEQSVGQRKEKNSEST